MRCSNVYYFGLVVAPSIIQPVAARDVTRLIKNAEIAVILCKKTANVAQNMASPTVPNSS